MEPNSCHCSPAAKGETDRPELKLVPFVTPTSAAKRQGRRQKARKPTVFLDRAGI